MRLSLFSHQLCVASSGWNTSPKRSTLDPHLEARREEGGRARGLVQTRRHRLREVNSSCRRMFLIGERVVQRLTTEVQHPEQKYISIHCPANEMWSSQMASCCTLTIVFLF